MKILRRFRRWLSLADELRAVRGELDLARKTLEAELSAVVRLEAEKAAQARELRLYRRYAGAIDEARGALAQGATILPTKVREGAE